MQIQSYDNYSVFQVACQGCKMQIQSYDNYSVFQVACPEEIKNGSWPCLYK